MFMATSHHASRNSDSRHTKACTHEGVHACAHSQVQSSMYRHTDHGCMPVARSSSSVTKPGVRVKLLVK